MNDSDSGFLMIPIKILLEDLKDPFFTLDVTGFLNISYLFQNEYFQK